MRWAIGALAIFAAAADAAAGQTAPPTESARPPVAAAEAPAQAAKAPAPTSGAHHEASDSTDVSGVTVAVSKTPPVVASTYPATGAMVTPGVMILKLVFDQQMNPEGWSYDKAPDGTYPQCLDHPRQLADGKSFVLLCTTAPNTAYGISINDSGKGFIGRGGRQATPFVLHFTTTTADSLRTISAAMKEAGLQDGDSPVEDPTPAPVASASVGTPAPPAEP